jgi:hypothetical protein
MCEMREVRLSMDDERKQHRELPTKHPPNASRWCRLTPFRKTGAIVSIDGCVGASSFESFSTPPRHHQQYLLLL